MMMRLLIACLLLICANSFISPYSTRTFSAVLFAKKKGKALVSDDFLSTLIDDENTENGNNFDNNLSDLTSGGDNDDDSTSSKKKKKKKEKKLAVNISDDVLNSIDESIDDIDIDIDTDNSASASETITDTTTETINDEVMKSSKKKDKKLAINLSADFLSNLDGDDDNNSDTTLINTDNDISNSDGDGEGEGEGTKKKKKKKKRSKKKEFDWSGSLDEGNDNSADTEIVKEKKSVEITNEDIQIEKVSDSDDSVNEQQQQQQHSDEEETLEVRARKQKPPARVRFAESSQPDYVMMGLQDVSLMYGNTVVLKDASFQVETGQRVGLVGPNGGGKTTMLKILAGDLEATTGEIIKSSKDLRVAFLKQEFTDELKLDNTLKQELLSAFVEEQNILNEISNVENEISRTTDDPKQMEKVLNRLAELQDEAIAKGVYSLESKVEKIMDTMGFGDSDADLLVERFSGGWKMRIGIAKILLLSPSLVLLDEPTNHLDLDSVFWLEDFLREQNIPMVIVSHDREFLDRVCNKIVDVEEGVTQSYDGNYSKFLLDKENRLAIWKDQYEKQQRYIKDEEKWIKKNKANEAQAQNVADRKRSLEKLMDSDDFVEKPPKDKKFRFRFPPAPRCGNSVVEAEKLGHGYGTGKHETLFKNVDIQVDRGNRVGFVGPNGSGKSTMMRLIMDLEAPREGWIEFGSANVAPCYFQQNQADAFDLDRTVLETVQDGAPSDISLTDIRALLGQFMFKNDDVNKKLQVLSGGEKGRVALCKMMLTPANLLCLDEPTNHLDITAKEVLEDALQHYEGSVLIISHDRYFMSQVANTIFHFDEKSMIRYDCDYHDFMGAMSDLQEKVESRYVYGDKYRITHAKEVISTQKDSSKKNFGGSGVTGGNLFKGIKNAKRYSQ